MSSLQVDPLNIGYGCLSFEWCVLALSRCLGQEPVQDTSRPHAGLWHVLPLISVTPAVPVVLACYSVVENPTKGGYMCRWQPGMGTSWVPWTFLMTEWAVSLAPAVLSSRKSVRTQVCSSSHLLHSRLQRQWRGFVMKVGSGYGGEGGVGVFLLWGIYRNSLGTQVLLLWDCDCMLSGKIILIGTHMAFPQLHAHAPLDTRLTGRAYMGHMADLVHDFLCMCPPCCAFSAWASHLLMRTKQLQVWSAI